MEDAAEAGWLRSSSAPSALGDALLPEPPRAETPLPLPVWKKGSVLWGHVEDFLEENGHVSNPALMLIARV